MPTNYDPKHKTPELSNLSRSKFADRGTENGNSNRFISYRVRVLKTVKTFLFKIINDALLAHGPVQYKTPVGNCNFKSVYCVGSFGGTFGRFLFGKRGKSAARINSRIRRIIIIRREFIIDVV